MVLVMVIAVAFGGGAGGEGYSFMPSTVSGKASVALSE